MKKLLTLLLLVFLASGITRAAAVDYLFTSSVGTYTEITGGTQLTSGTFDDNMYNTAIGFTFNANGVNFTNMNVSTNGYIYFHPTATGSLGYSPISTTSSGTLVVAPMGRDLQGVATSTLRVETLGTAPNRVTVIQWKEVKRYGTNYAGEVLNFQIRLYETLNRIEMIYGPAIGSAYASPTHPQVGLRGTANTDFFNRMTTTDWAASVQGTANNSVMVLNNLIVPPTGLTYTYKVAAPGNPVYTTPVNGMIGIPLEATLNWTAPPTGGAPSGYRVYFGTDNPPTNVANGVDVGTALSYDPASMTLNTPYFWRVVAYNESGVSTSSETWTFTTTLGQGDLQGFVTNGFGVPMGGVQVALSNPLGSFATLSAANGSYSFTGVTAANYTITATYAGYNTTVIPVYVAPMTITYQNIVMLHPSMAVTPNPYNVAVNPNEMLDGAINIANNGDGSLGWSASIAFTSPGPNTWLTLAQNTGTVNAYSNFNLPVYFNAAGLATGTIKTAEITFTSTPNVGTVVIPVTMTVTGTELVAPTSLNAVLSNPIDGVVNLTWSYTTAPGFQFFVIKRNGAQVGTTVANNFTNNLPAYGVYSYTVQAVYAEGSSAPAGPVSVEWANPNLVLDPTSLYNEQYPMTNEDVTFRISNTGEGTLAFSFPEYLDARGAGGPDAFGYEWIDSDETGGPAYMWNDISATGTLVTGLSDDNVVGPFDLGMEFPFYGNVYTQVYVSSNGYLEFGSNVSSLSNQNIPNTSTPNNVVAWCWDDLHGQGANSSVRYQDMGDYWIIQYTNYSTYPVSATNTITAQVHLHDNGDIFIYYNTINGSFSVTSSTVGIENSTGTIATKLAYNQAYIHGNMAVKIKHPVYSFITAVNPAQGQVPPGGFVDVVATFTADEDYPVGTHTSELEINTNDINNPVVIIPATMVVYEPGMLSGTVTSAVDGAPIFGAMIVAGPYSAMTDENGNYSIVMDAGTYTVTFSKTGYTSVTVNNVVITATETTDLDAELEEGFYPPTLVHAEVNDADTQVEVTWGVPNPEYEILYDDGEAENYTAWALAGNMNGVKFTPAGYPATVYGGKIYVGDGSFPNNNTGFLGTTFGAAVLDDDGTNGLPGTVIDSVEVTVNNYGWVTFSGLDATIESGSFYLVMIQGGISPNVAPVGVDETTPTSYRSYSRNVAAGGQWGLSPYQDMMIRALVSGPAGTDFARNATSEVQVAPVKQRGMLSLHPASGLSGKEGDALYLAIQNQQNRAVETYSIWRVFLADPDLGVTSGVQTLLADDVPTTQYIDAAFGPLPMGWYAYAVAANYTNGGQSEKVYSNIVAHQMDVQVTFHVSLTTGGSPAGAVVAMTALDYPYEVYSATVPEDGTVVFENVWKGNYNILAQKVGFDDYTISANIQSDRVFDIILAETKYAPTNLYVDPLTLVATWRAPMQTLLTEDFEGAVFPPAGWGSYTQNTNGWYAGTTGSSSFVIPPHTTFAVANDDEADGDGCCDYLWTPPLDLTTSETWEVHFQSFFNGAYSQTASVEVSTDGGSTWTVVHNMVPATVWTQVVVDLSDFAGPSGLTNAVIGFHANDNGAWASGWAIDDVVIKKGVNPSMGYGVFLDGALVGNTMETTYTYTNLNYGQTYLAGVAGLYSSGYSELDTYLFTSVYLIPPTNLAGVNPPQTDYVHLTWVAPTVPTLAPNMDALPVIVPQPAADIATVASTNNVRPQGSAPMTTSRNVLWDNGTIVNSPGTGSGGADESILQGDLGMTTYGSGMQQTAGNSIADDFTVSGNWTIDSFEFFGYQTGSSTTSTMTGIFFRIWDGNPMAGGTVIWGDLTTNKLLSTEWSNIYRNNNGPGGATDRPVMRIVADATGLSLPAGQYWVEWTATGSLSSGPWQPPITINGQTTTGDAIQNQAGLWVALTDVGPQGMPFIINGSGGGASVANLLGYNLYRDGDFISYVEKPALEYFDLDLEPGTYSYHITAVYDLTPYGFAGQTGESMIEGPISVDVIYGYDLPFFENWTTGLFETNEWSVEGTNWHIAGQAGNPAPAVEFTYAPVQEEYDLSLTSSWINGIGPDGGFIDGDIYLDFDLKLDDNTATGDEQLVVEVFNGDAWVAFATYTAEGDLDWEAQHVKITGAALNKVFRVRFTAQGMNTLDINNWQIDNIHIYRLCAAPTELVATLPDPVNHGDQILLEWVAPSTPIGPSQWIMWDDGVNTGGIGLNGGGAMLCAARFTPDQLEELAGTSLTKISIYPFQATGATFVLKVWTGANAGTLVASQPVTFTTDQWNEYVLNTPVYITGSTELWFGYEVTHADGTFPAGTDDGPAVAGFGDMISTDGGASWDPLSSFGPEFNSNWNIEGFVETVDGIAQVLQPIVNNTVVNNPNGTLVRSKATVISPNATFKPKNRDLVEFNVYRDEVLIGTTTETTYLDTDPAISILGQQFCYNVTAVYDDCESEFSNTACETVVNAENNELSAVNIYPNPSNSVLNIELTNDITEVVIYNGLGQIVNQLTITKEKMVRVDVSKYNAGAYLVKFISRSGDSFARKIAVTK